MAVTATTDRADVLVWGRGITEVWGLSQLPMLALARFC
jgi:hypothetical protein